MNQKHDHVIQVAVPVPLRHHFDYLWCEQLPAGSRVLVPFGRRKLIGIVLSSNQVSSTRQLKRLERVLDEEPTLDSNIFSLLNWAAAYYHHPIGEVMTTGLPVWLRQDQLLDAPQGETCYQLVRENAGAAHESLARAPAQLRLFRSMATETWYSFGELKQSFGATRQQLDGLEKRALVARENFLQRNPEPAPGEIRKLTAEQQQVANAICEKLEGYSSYLLQGITGSGKTEVYFAAARQVIAAGRQVLFLVPEIALTPQLVARVRAQLGGNVCVMHSGMSDRNRYNAWWQARQGMADAVLGTRSAVFTPLKSPGLIVIDEEHDQSYKQQDGFRYHARDLAIKRASIEDIPVVMGSATPSFESLRNARGNRHRLLRLEKRVGSAQLPRVRLVNLGTSPAVNGLSAPLIAAIEQRLERNEQVIIYINRRGYAPVVHCFHCGWQARCEHCDARLIYHRSKNQFRCHHCGYTQRASENCSECSTSLYLAGAGTQRVEQALLGRFPAARLCRLDRDEANTANKLYQKLDDIRLGKVDIVIGTQLITKGHDFSGVSLVGVVNADQGLYSADFRAPEIMFQQLLQVAGRAGRASADGEVLVQTAHPDHPCLQMLAHHDYDRFADLELDQRHQAGYPPFGHFALLRCESSNADSAFGFLQFAASQGRTLVSEVAPGSVDILHPVASPIEKIADRFRYQLLIRSNKRNPLHQLLASWMTRLEQDKRNRSVRWSLDIDPMEML